jgi:putative CocE/NonD family hydrolase
MRLPVPRAALAGPLAAVCAPLALAAQNPPRLAGDWDFWQNRLAHKAMAVVHLPPDSAGGWLKLRDGRQAATFAATRLSGDSIFLVLAGQPAQLAGVLRNDTIVGQVVVGARAVTPVWLVRRTEPPHFVSPYRLWPGPLSDSALAVTVDTAVPMRARDGTVLMSLVARPAGDGPFPVILERTPYGRRGSTVEARFFASRGYIVAVQDVRGRFGSGGTFRDLVAQDRDGYDAVEWAAALPGSSGKVGMLGGSYVGWTQWFAAVMKPPHLAAIVPIVSPPDPWLNVPYWNMDFAVAAVAWACLVSGKTNQDISHLNVDSAFRILPVVRIPRALGCQETDYWDDWMSHERVDHYWRSVSYQSRVPGVRVPVLAISGWYDDDGNGTTTNFIALGRAPHHPFERMVLGPWSHRGTPDLLNGEFGDEAYVTHNLLALRWFDHYLKGVANGVDTEPPVDLFVMGDNVWRQEREWPLARTRWTRFYLHSRGAANTSAGDGTLDTILPRAEPADTFSYDPGDPTPYIVDPRELELNLNEDYRRLEAERADILVYTSAPLARDVEVTGPLSVTLWAATDAKDTDWHAMLLDVQPDGAAFRVQDGIVRARFRDGFDREVFPVRDRPTAYRIDLWHTGLVFKAGHRIRVAIASAAFPKYGRNLNTGGDNNRDSTYVTAHQRILHDRAHASFITLPLIPR